MANMLSERVQRIAPSATFAVKAKENALRAKGIDVISFGIGEPDFDTLNLFWEHLEQQKQRLLDAKLGSGRA